MFKYKYAVKSLDQVMQLKNKSSVSCSLVALTILKLRK